jgi:hypothetical protein
MPYTRSYQNGTYYPRRRARRPATQEQVQAWADAHANNALVLDRLVAGEQAGTLNSFTSDILRKLRLYGSLSERQVAAVLRGFERDAEWAARREAEAAALEGVAPLSEGRRRIEGEIVSAKVKTSRYGWVAKMLVREASGNKVWGSIPRAMLNPDLHDGQNYTGSDETLAPLVGTTVVIVAQVRRSDDDQHFGFFSRPQLLAGGPEPTEALPPAYPVTREIQVDDGYGHVHSEVIEEDRDGEPVCPAGHRYDIRDGFCESCAEARMELQGTEYGEDL